MVDVLVTVEETVRGRVVVVQAGVVSMHEQAVLIMLGMSFVSAERLLESWAFGATVARLFSAVIVVVTVVRAVLVCVLVAVLVSIMTTPGLY